MNVNCSCRSLFGLISKSFFCLFEVAVENLTMCYCLEHGCQGIQYCVAMLCLWLVSVRPAVGKRSRPSGHCESNLCGQFPWQVPKITWLCPNYLKSCFACMNLGVNGGTCTAKEKGNPGTKNKCVWIECWQPVPKPRPLHWNFTTCASSSPEVSLLLDSSSLLLLAMW